MKENLCLEVALEKKPRYGSLRSGECFREISETGNEQTGMYLLTWLCWKHLARSMSRLRRAELSGAVRPVGA